MIALFFVKLLKKLKPRTKMTHTPVQIGLGNIYKFCWISGWKIWYTGESAVPSDTQYGESNGMYSILSTCFIYKKQLYKQPVLRQRTKSFSLLFFIDSS